MSGVTVWKHSFCCQILQTVHSAISLIIFAFLYIKTGWKCVLMWGESGERQRPSPVATFHAAPHLLDKWMPARERVLHQHRQAYVWQAQTPDRHKGGRRSYSLLSLAHVITQESEFWSSGLWLICLVLFFTKIYSFFGYKRLFFMFCL